GGSDSVSDDIVFNSRIGASVMNKISLDMADRSVLPIEQGSQAGWVPGNSLSPGIDSFRFDPHEYSNPTPFFIRRVKLAALERVNSGGTYTFRWTATKNGDVTLYYDTDNNPYNGGQTVIGSAPASAGSFTWSVPSLPLGEYYIYGVIDDHYGNANAVYAAWPVVIGKLPPSPPPNIRILF